jgi:N-acetylmuramoyl-L-alanine amidase
LFDWARLAKHRQALARPVKNLVDPLWTDGGFLLALERFGYDVRDATAAVIAFQRRFRPEHIDGEIEGECRAILLNLLLDRERGLAR